MCEQVYQKTAAMRAAVFWDICEKPGGGEGPQHGAGLDRPLSFWDIK